MSLMLKTHFDLARTSLKERKTRTFLTCLGISIGVASIILILSLMGSINSLISKQLENVGNNLIIVQPKTPETNIDSIVSELTSTNKFSKSNLTVADSNTIRNLNAKYNAEAEYPITGVAPLSINTYTLSADRTVDSATVLGTTKELKDILNIQLKGGTFINDNDLKTATIGKDLSLKLFGTTEPIGSTFNLHGQKFIITGILQENDDPVNFNNVDLDNAVVINIDQLRELDSNIQIQQINVQVASSDSVAKTADKIESTLKDFKDGDTNFSVVYGEGITHPAGSLLSIISGMLTAVASISLVVGGIGVMNIMLVAVSERTHEVGIRKAIGATNMNIFLQFLFESLILCILGGISGIILGYVLAFVLSALTPFAPYFDVMIALMALGVSVIVGTIFGLYPALKASLKNPIDSLKHYN